MTSFTFRFDDEINKIFRNHEYIGYIDEGERLFVFDKDGYAEQIGVNIKTTSDAIKLLTPKKKTKIKERELIRTLVAKLAIYEPNSETVRKGLEYLK